MRKELLLFLVLLAETERGCGREFKSFFCCDSKLTRRRESCCKTEEAQWISAAKTEREERTWEEEVWFAFLFSFLFTEPGEGERAILQRNREEDVQVIEGAPPQYILASTVEIASIKLIQRLGLQLGQQVVMKGGCNLGSKLWWKGNASGVESSRQRIRRRHPLSTSTNFFFSFRKLSWAWSHVRGE
jgi:hypothetical protein